MRAVVCRGDATTEAALVQACSTYCTRVAVTDSGAHAVGADGAGADGGDGAEAGPASSSGRGFDEASAEMRLVRCGVRLPTRMHERTHARMRDANQAALRHHERHP